VTDRTREIVQACLAMGFARAGVCAARPSDRADDLRRWLAAGKHGTMEWMEEWVEQRTDIRRLIDGVEVRSVIVVSDQYAAAGPQEQGDGGGEVVGRIARYARGRDYHDVIRKRLHQLCDRLRALHPGEQFRAFVDTAPVMEREHAARAGLGFIGKHTLLIDPARGSWLLLGGVATTMSLSPTAEREPEPHCGTCTRCIDACPTGAITPYAVDARRCISYLTIEHDGAIDPAMHAGIGSWLFGCDICQEVCPFNGASAAERPGRNRVHPLYRPREGLRGGGLAVSEVLGWRPEDRRVRLTVSAGKRASLEMLRRNAVIVAGNSNDAALHARVADLAANEDEPALVRETARVVSRRPG
jgi:epoxyqueuosine reductase